MELVYTPKGPVLKTLSTWKYSNSYCKVRFTLTAKWPVVPDLSPNIQQCSNLPCEMIIHVDGDCMTIDKILYNPNKSFPIYAFAYGFLWEISLFKKY